MLRLVSGVRALPGTQIVYQPTCTQRGQGIDGWMWKLKDERTNGNQSFLLLLLFIIPQQLEQIIISIVWMLVLLLLLITIMTLI